MTKRGQPFLFLLLISFLFASFTTLSGQTRSVKTFKNDDQNATLITGITLDSKSATIEAYGKRYLGEYTWGKQTLKMVKCTSVDTTYRVVYYQGIAKHTLYVTQHNNTNLIRVISETQYEGDKPEYAQVRKFELTRIAFSPQQQNSNYDGVGAANK